MSADASLIIRCECSAPDHLVVLDACHWDAFKPPHSGLYIHTELNPFLPWWKRLWNAALFVVRGRMKRYAYEETVVSDADAKRLRDFLSEYLLAAAALKERDAQ